MPKLGERGELAVSIYLEEHFSAHILGRNFKAARGELDIIATVGSELWIVEVKSRSSTLFGHPLEAISYKKQQALKRATADFLKQAPSSVRSFSALKFFAASVLSAPHGDDLEVELTDITEDVAEA